MGGPVVGIPLETVPESLVPLPEHFFRVSNLSRDHPSKKQQKGKISALSCYTAGNLGRLGRLFQSLFSGLML